MLRAIAIFASATLQQFGDQSTRPLLVHSGRAFFLNPDSRYASCTFLRNSKEVPMRATAIGLDIAKSVFQVHGVSADGKVVIKKRMSRGEVNAFFKQ
jgi:hypothetical protein